MWVRGRSGFGSPPRGSWLVLWLWAATATGCVLDDVDLEGARCPCAPGWTCGPGERCVRDGDAGAPDAGSVDAGVMDGGSIDAAGVDAASVDAGAPDGGPDAGPPDAGSPDAGPPDAGPPDAGPDDTACDDVHAGALFCDGFESAGFLAWDRLRTRDGTVTQSTTTRHRGMGAMHSQTTAGSGRADAEASPLSALSSGELWIRTYLYLPSGFDLVDMNVTTVHEAVSPYVGVGMGMIAGDRPYIWFGTEGRSAHAPAVTVPRDRWTCWELHIVLDDVSGSADLSIDGVTVAMETGVDTVPGGGMTILVSGLGYTDPTQSSAELFLDELVVDDAPIGCL